MTCFRWLVCLLGCVGIVGCVSSSSNSAADNNATNTNDNENDNTTDNSTNDNANVNTNENDNDTAFYPEGDAANGGILFLDINNACYVCHGNEGLGTTVYSASIRSTTAALIEEAIGLGSTHTGGEHPDFSSQDYADIEAFLAGDPVDTSTNGETDTNGTTT